MLRRLISPEVPTDPAGAEAPDSYLGSTDLIRLSVVVYNADRTRAAVYVPDSCGLLCGGFGWWLVEKSRDGSWRAIANPGCEGIM